MYIPKSARDHGTFYQLRNVLHRRSVNSTPKKNVNACEDFLTIVVTGHVLAAAQCILGMDSIKACPSAMLDPAILFEPASVRQSSLMSVCRAIVEKYTNFQFIINSSSPPTIDDKVHAYACQAISLGLLYFEFVDAIREGDGTRILRCWRYLLPLFRATGRKNYSLEALLMLYDHKYVFSPRLSHQLMWSRCINTRGIAGRNISCDLFMEHLNRLCKEAIAGLRANKSDKAIVRVGKAIGTLYPVLEQFDVVNSIATLSGVHSKPKSLKDLHLILQELNQAHVFEQKPSRQHKAFKNIKTLLVHNPDKLITWMMGHFKRLANK